MAAFLRRRSVLSQSFGAVSLLAVMATGAPAWAGEAMSPECIAVDRVKQPEATLYFDKDSPTPKASDRRQLDALAYNGKYKWRICVIGQADKQGNQNYNMRLAQKRAQSVVDQLVSRGLPRRQIDVGARGEAFTDTFFERFLAGGQDRRVDVYFLDNRR